MIAAMAGSTDADAARKAFPPAKTVTFETAASALAALLDGSTQALVATAPVPRLAFCRLIAGILDATQLPGMMVTRVRGKKRSPGIGMAVKLSFNHFRQQAHQRKKGTSLIAFQNVSPVRVAIFFGLVVLAACSKPPLEEAPQDRVKSTLEIYELPKGSIAARPGSSEANLAKFLASNENAPRTFRFNSSEFAPWSDELSVETKDTLSNIIIILNGYPTARLKIAGYTDDDGDAAANLALSQQRVDTLQKMMVTRGIDRSRIDAVGMGAANPVASNETPAGRAKNRRIEITVTAK